MRHPSPAHGINASKFSWGHQVWAGGRWHIPAGAESNGTFHGLFWRLERRHDPQEASTCPGQTPICIPSVSEQLRTVSGGLRVRTRVPWEAGPGC